MQMPAMLLLNPDKILQGSVQSHCLLHCASAGNEAVIICLQLCAPAWLQGKGHKQSADGNKLCSNEEIQALLLSSNNSTQCAYALSVGEGARGGDLAARDAASRPQASSSSRHVEPHGHVLL